MLRGHQNVESLSVNPLDINPLGCLQRGWGRASRHGEVALGRLVWGKAPCYGETGVCWGRAILPRAQLGS